MQFDLGRRADYAIRCVLDLARHRDGDLRKARDIAADMAIPRSYVASILATLVEAGLVTSEAGRYGGYALASRPSDVTLLEVIESTEGALSSTSCVLRGGPCHWEERCAVHEPWARAQTAMRSELAATDFAELLRLDEALANPADPSTAQTL